MLPLRWHTWAMCWGQSGVFVCMGMFVVCACAALSLDGVTCFVHDQSTTSLTIGRQMGVTTFWQSISPQWDHSSGLFVACGMLSWEEFYLFLSSLKIKCSLSCSSLAFWTHQCAVALFSFPLPLLYFQQPHYPNLSSELTTTCLWKLTVEPQSETSHPQRHISQSKVRDRAVKGGGGGG